MHKGLTNNIQLNWLRTFEAAARQLSFTLAAEELYMSQSAVSQQIQLLEHHLAQKLFVRANRAIQLSDAGRAFLPLVQDSMSLLNTGAAQIFSPVNASMVEVNVNESFGVLWLATHMAKFHAIYPQVTVRQLGTNWESDFERSTTELEIRYGSGDWSGFEAYPLITPNLRPYCSAENAKRLRSPEDLVCLPLLEVIGAKQGWDSWLTKMGLSSLMDLPRHYTDSHASAVSMAANGCGICLMYDEMMQEGVLAKQLVAPFMDSIETKGNYYLCYRKGLPLSAASTVFCDWLLSESRFNPQ
ncbi:LysR family transcriptional regulator [Marinomonas flavescens]|uniref:LysR family transcriptional regulator n=1 Tax=Marinomonas flavescens TaxID=2529379 RepID=UPI0010557FFB|nr:LysR family transcriptional regulator [Marinomonas flavescens]